MLNKRSYVAKTPNKEEWCVKSENNPKWNGGCYKSKSKAKDRLNQVERIKHMKNKRAYVESRAATYDDKDQEKQWKPNPLGGEGNIGDTHKFPANSNDIRNRRRPGYFKWLNKEQVTPYNASPADFISAPMNTEANMVKEARESDAAWEKKIQKQMRNFKANMITIRPNEKKGKGGISAGIFYGIIELNLSPNVVLTFTTQNQSGKYVTKVDWTNGGGLEGVIPFKEYVELLASENGQKYLESGGDPDKFKSKGKPGGKTKPTKPTARPEEWYVAEVLGKIPESNFKKQEIKGQTWHSYNMPVDEFRAFVEKNLILYKYFEGQKSGMPEGEFIWKINPNGVLILK